MSVPAPITSRTALRPGDLITLGSRQDTFRLPAPSQLPPNSSQRAAADHHADAAPPFSFAVLPTSFDPSLRYIHFRPRSRLGRRAQFPGRIPPSRRHPQRVRTVSASSIYKAAPVPSPMAAASMSMPLVIGDRLQLGPFYFLFDGLRPRLCQGRFRRQHSCPRHRPRGQWPHAPGPNFPRCARPPFRRRHRSQRRRENFAPFHSGRPFVAYLRHS